MVGVGAIAGGGMSSDLQALLAGRDTRFYRGHLLRLTCIIFLVLITSMTNGYDGSMMNGLQALDNWKQYFGSPTGGLLGLFNAIQNIGGLVGLPFAPWVSDTLGRRTGIMLGCIIMMIGVALQTAAQNIGMFIAARGLVGFGLSFATIAAPVLITELAFPTHRAGLTSLYNSTWYLGSIVAAWTTYGTFRLQNTWSWRIPSLLQGLPSVLQILFIYAIPESPRWLIDHGREADAVRVIAKYHCGGDYDDPLVAYEIDEIKEALRLEKEAKQGTSFLSLFQTRGNLRRLRIIVALAFFSQWSGNGLVSYYLTLVLDGIGITSEGTQTLINGILQLFNYGTAIFGALIVDRAGRRPLFLTSTAGMCAAYICWTICSAIYQKSATNLDAAGVPIGANKTAGNGVLGFIFIYYAFYNIALSPHLVSYTVEILPFRIRSKGLMLMQFCVSASLVFNQYVNPIAMDALNWKYYIVYCVWLAFETVYFYFFVIETKGKNGPLPLEEIAMLFDGPRALDDVARAGHGALHDAAGTPPAEDDKKGDVYHVERAGTLEA
ncbi:hypothetical protein Q5752_006789 [Cryptotrichosporon argae]